MPLWGCILLPSRFVMSPSEGMHRTCIYVVATGHYSDLKSHCAAQRIKGATKEGGRQTGRVPPPVRLNGAFGRRKANVIKDLQQGRSREGHTGHAPFPVSLEGAPREQRHRRDKGFAGAEVACKSFYTAIMQS